MAKVNEQKNLCLILDSGLSIEKHRNEKIIKAKNNRRIINHVTRFYQLRLLIKCKAVINHIPTKQDQFGATLNSPMEKAERNKYQAALTGKWHGLNRSNLGWES